ncbi:hypothetical protein [Brevibacterium marinum]|uniref:Uncharacterized protein n=1 Tax=Brevibacterium marinum TaxID=418643 RepID=A0A846RYB3_9MICO|nr:hypothetical protein [Brevibacterium marinum]NJC54981.1 hypothetical protein [Brevibacterium marinum]
MLSLNNSADTTRTRTADMSACTQPFILSAGDAIEALPWEGLYISVDR